MPEVLRKYIPGQPSFIPYTKELPKDSTSQKAKEKPNGGVKGKVEEAKKSAEAAVDAVTEKVAAMK